MAELMEEGGWQLLLFPVRRRTAALAPPVASQSLAACPRCGATKTNAWGWIVSFDARGARCPDCWEIEP